MSLNSFCNDVLLNNWRTIDIDIDIDNVNVNVTVSELHELHDVCELKK